MKVIKHIKTGSLIYVSHIDSMRVLQRTLIRAHISTKMSEGFNPHPITYTSHPLPLGVGSEEEFFVVANDDMTKEQVLEAFNNNVPAGMKAVACFDCVKNPNLASNVNYCEYYVLCKEAIKFKEQIENLNNLESWIIEYPFKDSIKQQDIAPLIYQLKVDEGGIKMIIATGNPNLRPDRVCIAINEKYPLNIGVNDIIRKKHLVICGGKILTAEQFMQGFIK